MASGSTRSKAQDWHAPGGAGHWDEVGPGEEWLSYARPAAEGVIPKPSVELLKQVGNWLDRNGEAIYGTSPSPFPADPAWGCVTCKGNTIYLLVKAWPASDLKIDGLRNKVRAARILGAADAKIEIKQDGETLSLFLPEAAPDENVSVVALDLDGAP